MKKTLATLLVLAMVASLCCMMFVSAEESTNLALGKTVTGAEPKSGSNYTGALTDGNAADALSYDNNWFAYYWNPDKTPDENYANGANSVEGVGTPVVDLGEICTLDTVRVNTFLGCKDGITPPDYLTVEVSGDGETYTEIASVDFEEAESGDTTVGWVEVEMGGVAAQYVRLKLGHVATWVFLNEIEVYGVVGAAAGGDDEAPAQTWEDTYVVNEIEKEDGTIAHEAAVEVPYGYTWTIDDINGGIGGEDATICTTQDAYNACNPNWAITLYLEKQADGTYVAIQDAIVCPGSAANAGITVDEDHIAVVIHSASSDPYNEDGYDNWESKIVAVAVKTGDVFTVDTEAMTVYAEIPGGSSDVEPPVDDDNAYAELEAELEALVGAPVDAPAYTWTMDTVVAEDGKVTVTLKLTGVNGSELQCIEGIFHYDTEAMTLLNTADKENALLCITEPKGSEGEWENMSAVLEDGSIRLGATTFNLDVTMSDEDPMIFTLEFQLNEGVTLTGMYIDTENTYGMNLDADNVYGNGAYGIAQVEVEEPESSVPGDDSSDDVPAGDAGILVFAVLGILAIAGTAVVIKVRN